MRLIMKITTDADVTTERVLTLAERTRRPSHPGALLRDIIEELGWSQGELAQRLGVSRRTVSEVLLEKRPLTADMAHRIGRLLGNGAGFWIRLQAQLDTWDALHRDTSVYESIEPIEKWRAAA
jgi:addiction module HigA family antidote